MKPESISEKLMFNTVRLETETGMGTGFFYNFKVGEKRQLHSQYLIFMKKYLVNTAMDSD